MFFTISSDLRHDERWSVDPGGVVGVEITVVTVERWSVDPGGVAVVEITVDGCCRGLVAAGEPLERAQGLEERLGVGATVVSYEHAP